MNLVDWTARWNPMPDHRPGRVWLPAQRTPAPAAAGGQGAAAVPATREPQSITLTLTPQHADDLPLWLPHVLAQQDVRPGDRITVDLVDLQSVRVTGLELLLTVLWRRVGTDGDVLLTGGTPALRAELTSLHATPAACRAMVYGPVPAPPGAPGPVPAPTASGAVWPSSAAEVPAQRRAEEPLAALDTASDARLEFSGDVNLTVDLRTQARLNALLDQPGTRTLTLDLSDVTYLSLSTLRLLLDADRRLRARGGRLRLLHPNQRVQRLLAITSTSYLADAQPVPATCPAPPQRAVADVRRAGAAGPHRRARRRSHSRPPTAAFAAEGRC
jgi:anti-anti-sigma factor